MRARFFSPIYLAYGRCVLLSLFWVSIFTLVFYLYHLVLAFVFGSLAVFLPIFVGVVGMGAYLAYEEPPEDMGSVLNRISVRYIGEVPEVPEEPEDEE